MTLERSRRSSGCAKPVKKHRDTRTKKRLTLLNKSSEKFDVARKHTRGFEDMIAKHSITNST